MDAQRGGGRPPDKLRALTSLAGRTAARQTAMVGLQTGGRAARGGERRSERGGADAWQPTPDTGRGMARRSLPNQNCAFASAVKLLIY